MRVAAGLKLCYRTSVGLSLNIRSDTLKLLYWLKEQRVCIVLEVAHRYGAIRVKSYTVDNERHIKTSSTLIRHCIQQQLFSLVV
jgi:hypothetical protein